MCPARTCERTLENPAPSGLEIYILPCIVRRDGQPGAVRAPGDLFDFQFFRQERKLEGASAQIGFAVSWCSFQVKSEGLGKVSECIGAGSVKVSGTKSSGGWLHSALHEMAVAICRMRPTKRYVKIDSIAVRDTTKSN